MFGREFYGFSSVEFDELKFSAVQPFHKGSAAVTIRYVVIVNLFIMGFHYFSLPDGKGVCQGCQQNY